MKKLSRLFRWILSLRYKVVVSGIENLPDHGSCIVLPNHQALIDPQIMVSTILEHRIVVPVITEGMYNIPGLKALFKNMNAIPVSDLSSGSRDTDVLRYISGQVLQRLEHGHCVLLYPSGQITGQGHEKILNKKSAWVVVSEMPPETRVVGVRIRGLWGSMWSRAWIGKSPNLVSTYLHGMWLVAANLVFFCPRRRVTIEFEDLTSVAKQWALAGKSTFNNNLETFYNQGGEEPALFLKHYFYAPASKRQVPSTIVGSVADYQSSDPSHTTSIPEGTLDHVLSIILDDLQLEWEGVTTGSNLALDLGIDSITLVSIVTVIENHFKVQAPDVTRIKTAGDLCLLALGVLSDKSTLKESTLHLTKTGVRTVQMPPLDTIHACFTQIFSSDTKEPFAWDNTLGTSTRQSFYTKTMVVAQIIKKEIPSQRVGIMLPALQSTTLLVAATYMAGKTPVMLNWTVGQKTLQHCVESVELTHILTATSFMDRIRDQVPPSVKEKCVMFDKKVREASLMTKIKGLISTLIKPQFDITPDDIAVILFTSGSESQPKAVPLTHRNILSDLDGALSHINVDNTTIFLSYLPPFHSFGFSVLGVLPLCTGLRIAYTPDPTASREVVDILSHTRANTLLSTPTFLKMLLSVATKKQLENLKLVITGAESLYPSVIETFTSMAPPTAKIVEGYGITECSPVLSLTPLGKPKLKSVGTFIKTVDYLITDLATNEPLPPGNEGMIMVTGQNIFGGYLDKNIQQPFTTIGGNTYYVTGDLGHVDHDGYLFITGRLKRFVKIGGEMISLPAIEQCLSEKYSLTDEISMAVEGTDSIDPPRIFLFTKTTIDRNEANAYLRRSGLSNLARINKVVTLDEIPVLGTGKIDYKVLKKLITNE